MEKERSEIVYFKLYKTQIPVVEKAIETAALMLGSDKSRGYCLEMICADFVAGLPGPVDFKAILNLPRPLNMTHSHFRGGLSQSRNSSMCSIRFLTIDLTS
jgi:hypothetical protein